MQDLCLASYVYCTSTCAALSKAKTVILNISSIYGINACFDNRTDNIWFSEPHLYAKGFLLSKTISIVQEKHILICNPNNSCLGM
jgi:hypothetical protein